MPGLRHILNARLALVADQNECQGIVIGPTELIDARALARFGTRPGAVRFLNRDCVAGNRIIAPDLCFWHGSRDMKCTVAIQNPDSTQ